MFAPCLPYNLARRVEAMATGSHLLFWTIPRNSFFILLSREIPNSLSVCNSSPSLLQETHISTTEVPTSRYLPSYRDPLPVPVMIMYRISLSDHTSIFKFRIVFPRPVIGIEEVDCKKAG